jgi:hypothetical protein
MRKHQTIEIWWLLDLDRWLIAHKPRLMAIEISPENHIHPYSTWLEGKFMVCSGSSNKAPLARESKQLWKTKSKTLQLAYKWRLLQELRKGLIFSSNIEPLGNQSPVVSDLNKAQLNFITINNLRQRSGK